MFSSLHMFSLSPGWIGFLFYYDIVGSLLAKGDIHIWETKQWLTSELLITKWIEKAMSSVIGPLNCNNHPCLLLHLFSAKAKGTVFGEVPWSVILYLITHYNHHPCGNTACKAGCTLWPPQNNEITFAFMVNFTVFWSDIHRIHYYISKVSMTTDK